MNHPPSSQPQQQQIATDPSERLYVNRDNLLMARVPSALSPNNLVQLFLVGGSIIQIPLPEFEKVQGDLLEQLQQIAGPSK